MEQKLYSRIGYFFILVLIFTLLGFFPTYFMKFPVFEGLTSAHHLHAAVALLWIFMLILQPFLIKSGRYSLHRTVGRLSYVVMPLLLLSFFGVARAGYFRNIKTMSQEDALAALTNGIPDMLYMGTLYTLGIVYRKRTAWHLRFFTATGIMILGPGLGRFAFASFHAAVAGVIMATAFLIIPLLWMIMDIRKKKSPVPIGIFILISFTAVFTGQSGHSAWWQHFARWLTGTLF